MLILINLIHYSFRFITKTCPCYAEICFSFHIHVLVRILAQDIDCGYTLEPPR